MSMDIGDDFEPPRRGHPRDGVRQDLYFPHDDGMTRQEFAEDSDINTIVRKYGSYATLGEPPIFGDFSEVPDYQTALNLINQARDSFMELPSSLRARFDNDPGAFIAFMDDPANGDELITLGLRKPPPKAEPATGSASAASAGGEAVKEPAGTAVGGA